jgi:hypothetical protein
MMKNLAAEILEAQTQVALAVSLAETTRTEPTAATRMANAVATDHTNQMVMPQRAMPLALKSMGTANTSARRVSETAHAVAARDQLLANSVFFAVNRN